MQNYNSFLEKKKIVSINRGFEVDGSALNAHLFNFQRDIVKWALKKGSCALFADTGLGKTIMQLSWADEVSRHTNKNILILAPLAVSIQTKKQGEQFGISVNLCRSQSDVKNGINITNYEMLDNFDASEFAGIVLDESSILKSFSGKTTKSLIEKFKYTPYKLACSATPSPNDYEELGNHSEFLGVMTRREMLSMFFVHDGGNTAQWRIKGHGERKFFEWIANWAMVLKDPADLGYDGTKYKLPPLKIVPIVVESPQTEYSLVPLLASTLSERRDARKESIDIRVAEAKKIAESAEFALIWCDYNAESSALSNGINGAVEVKGADTAKYKESAMIGFSNGTIKRLVSKPSICGFGMNWQHCNTVIFCGLSDSYEKFYQAIRRCYRFGQKREVSVFVIISERELSVLENIKRKEELAEKMSREMVKLTADILKAEIKNTTRNFIDYVPQKQIIIPLWLKEVV